MTIDNESRLSVKDTRWSGTFMDMGEPQFHILLAPQGDILVLRKNVAKAAAVLLHPEAEREVSQEELAYGLGLDMGQLRATVRNVMAVAPLVGAEIRESGGMYLIGPHQDSLPNGASAFNGNSRAANSSFGREYPWSVHDYHGSLKRGVNRVVYDPRGVRVHRRWGK